MENVFEKMQSTFTDLASKTSEFIERAELDTKIKAVGEKTKKVVREHPLESILAGVALGFIIGRLFRRNDG